MSERRILVVGAHCDDETFGCGGLIASVVAAGGMVSVLTASHVEVTLGEFHSACSAMGVAERRSLYLPTTRVPSYVISMAEAIRDIIAEQRITEVYAHAADDTHQDHRAVAEAVRIAAGPGSPARLVAEYEAPLSGIRPVAFSPNAFVEIDIERKLEVLALYRSQVQAAPSQRSLEVTRALAVVRGSQCGRVYAEGFRIVRCRL